MKASFKKRSQDELEKFYQQNSFFINSLKESKIPKQSKIEIKEVETIKETEPVQKAVQNELQNDYTKTEQRKGKQK